MSMSGSVMSVWGDSTDVDRFSRAAVDSVVGVLAFISFTLSLVLIGVEVDELIGRFLGLFSSVLTSFTVTSSSSTIHTSIVLPSFTLPLPLLSAIFLSFLSFLSAFIEALEGREVVVVVAALRDGVDDEVAEVEEEVDEEAEEEEEEVDGRAHTDKSIALTVFPTVVTGTVDTLTLALAVAVAVAVAAAVAVIEVTGLKGKACITFLFD